MPSQPTGEIPPPDGALPGESAGAWGERDFGFYVHVPFCASRCGYCDFNTYTAPELAGSTGVADRSTTTRSSMRVKASALLAMS